MNHKIKTTIGLFSLFACLAFLNAICASDNPQKENFENGILRKSQERPLQPQDTKVRKKRAASTSGHLQIPQDFPIRSVPTIDNSASQQAGKKRSTSTPEHLNLHKESKAKKTHKSLEEFIFPEPSKVTFWEAFIFAKNNLNNPFLSILHSMGYNWLKTKADALDLITTENPPLFLTNVKLTHKETKDTDVNSLVSVKFTYMMPIIYFDLCFDGTFSFTQHIPQNLFVYLRKTFKSPVALSKSLLHWQKNYGKGLLYIFKFLNKGEPLMQTPHEIVENQSFITYKNNPDWFKQIATDEHKNEVSINNPSFTNADVGGVADLCNMNQREKLTFNKSNIRLLGIRQLNEHTADSTTLTKTRFLNEKNLGDLAAIEIFSHLPRNSTEVELQGNHIGDATFIVLSTLTLPRTITKLSFRKNFITSLGFQYLMRCDLPSLEELDLSYNSKIDDTAFRSVSFANFKKLKTINLSHTAIGDATVRNLMLLNELFQMTVHYTNITPVGEGILLDHNFKALKLVQPFFFEAWINETKSKPCMIQEESAIK